MPPDWAAENPRCHWAKEDQVNCEESHPDYRHAESFAEAYEVIASGQAVYDVDGDLVTGIVADPPPSYEFRLPSGNTDTHDDPHSPDCFLIPDFTPVTDEELAEVYRSLGVDT
jgi:hypothetical protein